MDEDLTFRFSLIDVGQYDVAVQELKEVGEIGLCEGQFAQYGECEGEIEWRGAATKYCWNGEGKNPNRELLLCDRCAKEYYDYWVEMFNNVPRY